MKLVLKILALPVLFVVKVICILGNLLTNVVSYVIGLLLLVIGGSAIYCIVKASCCRCESISHISGTPRRIG